MPKGRRGRRRDKAIAWYRGVPYVLDLRRCRMALVRCELGGDFGSMEALAERVQVSRSTASRFFSGRPTSLTVTNRLIDVLGLEHEDVLRPATPEEVAELNGELGDVA
jgi:hypothetical protein